MISPGSAIHRLHATRRALLAAGAARAVLWTAAAGAAVLAIVGAAAWVTGWTARPELALPVAAAAALAAGAVAAWPARHAASLERVALWVEERRPGLRYSLVTLADARFSAGPDAARLGAVADAEDWRPDVWRAALRAPLPPAVVLAAALALLALAPAPARGPSAGRSPLGAVFGPRASSPPDPLRPLAVAIVPPAYSGLEERRLEDPDIVGALVGSRLVLTASGPADSVTASVGARAVAASAQSGGRWGIAISMPPSPVAMTLSGPRGDRVLTLEPRPDSAPAVALREPAQDTVLREPRGSIRIAAVATDDLGLADLRVEYIISSGEGESFTFRSGVLGGATGAGRRELSIALRLPLDSLGLGPGDWVHLRAVARDRNDVSGPGEGASETRAIRIARPSEYDSISLTPAPPPEAEASAISQRMLIRLAEALENRRPRMPRDEVVAESRAIARDQGRLRQQIGDLVFMRLGGEASGEHFHGDGHEHGQMPPADLLAAAEAATGVSGEALDFHGDETPVVAVNRPLLEAYNAMWAAGSELEIGEPDDALPHMRAALDAIQRARQAERIYLRGRPPEVVVDLARVRLAGERDDARPAARGALPALDTAIAARVARFDRAVATLAADPGAAIDSLLLLRLAALPDAPDAAAALAVAVERLRSGDDATDALVRTRRLLAGAPVARPGLPRWGGGVP